MAIIPVFHRIMGSGKLPVIAGSQDYGPGTHSPVIPSYDTLVVEIWGAGAGGGGVASSGPNTYQGGSPGASYFQAPSVTLLANSGSGGWNGQWYKDGIGPAPPTVANGSAGSHGSASGGDVNTTAGGRSGGAGTSYTASSATARGGDGGYGGYVRKTWTYGQAGAPVVGSAYTLVVQAGGAGGYGNYVTGNAGVGALARLTWS